MLEKNKQKLAKSISIEQDSGSAKDIQILNAYQGDEVSSKSSQGNHHIEAMPSKSENESFDWEPSEEHASYDNLREKEEGYINKCIADIKQYYRDPTSDPNVVENSDSSQSSSFNMGKDLKSYNSNNFNSGDEGKFVKHKYISRA